MQRLKEIFQQFYNINNFYKPVVFLDTETTGFGNSDRIIEIGAIGITFDGIDVDIKTFSTLVYPGVDYVELSPKIVEVTKIASEDLKASNVPDEVTAYTNFKNWLLEISSSDYCELVAHNASFDENKIRTNMSRLGISFPWSKFTCTKIMAANVHSKDKKLNTLAEHYGFINEQQHRALTDAETCAYIWARMKLSNV